MSKKLKIKFWKAEKALAMQILEQEGLPEKKMDGFVHIFNFPSLDDSCISLRGKKAEYNLNINDIYADTNSERDEHLDKITNAITDELFTGTVELKVGDMCEVKISDGCEWVTRKLLAILPEEQSYRYICNHSSIKDTFTMCKYALPLPKRIEPKVEENGEIITYTWEEK